MKLRFTPRAMNDLTAIRRFIQDEYGNPKAAKRITDSIFAQCTNLKQFPQSGTALSARFEIDTDVRYLVCEGYMQSKALKRLMAELDTGWKSAERDGWVSEEEAMRRLETDA